MASRPVTEPRFAGFPPEARKFLRSLKRNNRREWFQLRKEQFETQVKAPMLAIYGDRSGFLPTMNRISRIVPNCETCVIPGVGHLLPVVAPRLFVHHVRTFLAVLHEGRQKYAAHR